jgi:hypothetical protein
MSWNKRSNKSNSSQLQQQDQALETDLVTRYEQNMTKLAVFYAQRAKKNWIKDGDRNTSYFHKSFGKRWK